MRIMYFEGKSFGFLFSRMRIFLLIITIEFKLKKLYFIKKRISYGRYDLYDCKTKNIYMNSNSNTSRQFLSWLNAFPRTVDITEI